MKKLSLVVSVYNEEEVLEHFYEVTAEVLKQSENAENRYETEIIFVNDGSKDKSPEILKGLAERDRRCKVISFSKNFGHEAAMAAGLDYATGDFTIVLDADCQNPPELIPSMLAEYEAGNDIILMAREENRSAGLIKKITSDLFYKTLNKMSDVEFERNVSDFFGLSKRAADVVRSTYRERTRYLRGYIQQIGFNKSVIKYKAPKRFAGESKYSIKKLAKIAVYTFDCFAVTPLKASLFAAGLSLFLTLASLVYYIVCWIVKGEGQGVALLCTFLSFLFTVLFVMLGIIGEYLGNLMKEVRERPIYIIEETKNIKEKDNV